jgi:superfamily I DNA and RNA helicase
MNLINRDMSPKERDRLAKQKRNLREFAEALNKGEILKEDLPPEVLKQLRDKLLE